MIMRTLCFIVLMCACLAAHSQVRMIDLYQYNYTSISPAFAGLDGTKITAMGNVFVSTPEWPSSYHNVYAGFETKLGKYGLGLTSNLIDEGWQSMLHVSVPVNYQWGLDEKRKLVFAWRPSFVQVGLGFQVDDPTMPREDPKVDGHNYRQGFTNSVALLYKTDKYFIGASADNIVHSRWLFGLPEFTAIQYNLMAGKNFRIDKLLSSEHSIYAAWIGNTDLYKVDLNNTLVIGGQVLVGFSLMIDYDVYPKVNAGWRFGKLGQAVISLYSATNSSEFKKFSGQMMLQFNFGKQSSV